MNITGGIYKGRKLKAPDENIVRPTLSKIRMGIFNSLFSCFGDFEGLTFLDMFGGSGIMGLEALSRGFLEVVVFEKNKQVSQIIKENYSKIGISPNLYVGDSISLYKKINKSFDVVYIDPPYESDIYEKCLSVLKDFKLVILEHTKEIDFNDFNVIKQKKYGDKYLTFLTVL